MAAIPMIELWRGGMLESVHHGHAVVFGPGGVEQVWGDGDAVIYPRSSCKMMQALPLIESGAADAAGLGPRELALACASHSGGAIHTDTVAAWLDAEGFTEADLRCGTHKPWDSDAAKALICTGDEACQLHNNCSGKHAGFLTLNKHLKGGPEYVELDHPIQRAIKTAFEEVTQESSPAVGIDGCSAPNFACSLTGLARAMAAFAGANPEGTIRERAMVRLHRAMAAHPDLVAGEGRACTGLMRAAGGAAAVKTGAEAVFIAILPEQKRGVALKITDGATRASEAAICALLMRLGVIDPADPITGKLIQNPQKNWRGLAYGEMRLSPEFSA